MIAPEPESGVRLRELLQQLRCFEALENSHADPAVRERFRTLRDELLKLLERTHDSTDVPQWSAAASRRAKLPSAASLLRSGGGGARRRLDPPCHTAAADTHLIKESLPLPAVAAPPPAQPTALAVAERDLPPAWKRRSPARDMGQSRREQQANRSEWIFSWRSWKAPIFAAAALLVVGALGFYAVESARVGRDMFLLSNHLRQETVDPAAVREICQRLASSRFARLLAERDYLLAQAAVRLGDPSDPRTDEVVRRYLQSAVAKAPADVWRRLTSAAWPHSSQTDAHFAVLERITRSDPAALEGFALVLERTGFAEQSRDALRRVMELDPLRTGAIVEKLFKDRIPTELVLDLVPEDPRALLELTKAAQPWNSAAIRRAVELKLTRIAGPAPNPGGSDSPGGRTREILAATEQVRAWLSRPNPVGRVQPASAN
jgi:hypothetical protein